MLNDALYLAIAANGGGGGGSGDLEQFYTTSVYQANDIMTAADREKLETLASNPDQYCAFIYFTLDGEGTFRCPIFSIKIPASAAIQANGGPGSGGGRVNCSWTIQWATNTISKFTAYIPKYLTTAQTPTSSYIKIYKYK